MVSVWETKRIPRHEPVLSKSYFVSVTSAGHNHELKLTNLLIQNYLLWFLYIIWEMNLLLLEHLMAMQKVMIIYFIALVHLS